MESGHTWTAAIFFFFLSLSFFPWQILQQCACRAESGPLRWEVGGSEGKGTFHHSVQKPVEENLPCCPDSGLYTTSIFKPPSTDPPASHFSNHAAMIRGTGRGLKKKSIVLARRQAAPQMKKNAPVPACRASKMITLTEPSITCSLPLPAGENAGCSVPAERLGGGAGRRRGGALNRHTPG